MRILVVDDSIMMRRVISQEFEGPDYEVFQAVAVVETEYI